MENTLNNKYYTPNETELFIGYECEITYAINHISYNIIPNEPVDITQWSKVKLSINEINLALYDEADSFAVRTEYLQHEQIESLEFEYDDKWEEGHVYYSKEPFTKNCLYMLIYNNILHTVIIKKFNITTNEYDIKFDGECKSINELRTVLKLIKYENSNS